MNILTKVYPNEQLEVYLTDERGLPLAELSINVNSVELNDNEFILKDYSENQLLVNQLFSSGLIIPTDRFIFVGKHLCPICKIQN